MLIKPSFYSHTYSNKLHNNYLYQLELGVFHWSSALVSLPVAEALPVYVHIPNDTKLIRKKSKSIFIHKTRRHFVPHAWKAQISANETSNTYFPNDIDWVLHLRKNKVRRN